jgi:hypothetical protein
MTIEDWLAGACADADRRGIPDLKPLLASLADATRTLRDTDWEWAGRAGTRTGGPEPAPSSSPSLEGATR